MTAETQQIGGEVTPLKGIRRAAAKHMIAAWQAPAFHLSAELDMSAAKAVKNRVPGATVTDAVILACAQALVAHPAVNSWYEDLSVRTFGEVNIGIAVATPAGLVVPVLHNVQDLGIEEIAAGRRDLVERARAGTLTRADVTGGTFTISNLGMLDIDRFDAILNVPQVAILAVAATRTRPVWTGDQADWRPVAEFTLTCDHRAIDGATGAAFLGEIRSRLLAGQIPDAL